MSTPSGYIRHFIACNRHDLGRFAPFFIGGKRYGYIKNDLAATLLQESKFFTAQKDGIALAPPFADFASRSEAIKQATNLIAQKYGKPLRNEMYAVAEKWDEEPVAQIDRAAVPWFGVRAWGVHVNGYVRRKNGLYLWVGQRASDRPADPGKFDNMIGGGQPIGLTPEQNLCKEAREEAGIDASLAMTAKKTGEISYRLERHDGLRSDTLFIHDLELPEDFVPANMDGEVERFILMPLSEIAALIRDTDKFKFNCNLVIIDFMIRHGFIGPQDDEYQELIEWLKKTRTI